ncbi:hypothetical protein Kpol_1073p22 [Vanderwaltozyma polyspora DSM 70294]|uniref:Chromosome segregation in meiosis protein n=1 Tax=Vanderwaltozyma polyspora (strain ATCC 22028 / DSM 70294 / BCRC 21397 / CBS 2163 / NBRC 10782 / NRRL Y-8283 / UCD 57-17) TaxID=436907 RepID=A7TPT3_VANPO|nr:uncharacterized protein Kpol_1073p22 [Vanderwaltozyma polyspora DSM 70294]EDO15734.1 hypothetical protein Kpol_1073p22 [Vanderwaltozyma polyspora DSM 70294]
MDDTFLHMGDEDPTETIVKDNSNTLDPTAVITKKRKPTVKLSSDQLLSDRGLPYVLANGPKRIRISKKNSNHQNLNNIILFYQLWAHDVFPRAKFKDFIKLCNTLGKSDRILREYRLDLFRKEMGIHTDQINIDQATSIDTLQPTDNATEDSIPIPDGRLFVADEEGDNNDDDEDDDDIYSHSLNSRRKPTESLTEEPEPNDNDGNLDQLEQQWRDQQLLLQQQDEPEVQDDDEDDLEAMREMRDDYF